MLSYKKIRILFSYFLPCIILSFLCMTMIMKPLFIFRSIYYGWWIFSLVLAAIVCMGIGIILHLVSKTELNATGTVNVLFAIITIVLVSCGCTGVIGPSEIHLTKAKDFNSLMNLPSANHLNYILDNDIDFQSQKDINWVGKIKFYGDFNGNYHTISNIHVTLEENPSAGVSKGGVSGINGIFSENRGKIYNLAVENCKIKVSAKKQNYAQAYGILVGLNLGTIDNILMKNNSITVTEGDKYVNVGGLCGVSNCNGYTSSKISNIAFINTDQTYEITSENGDCGAIVGMLFPCTVMKNLFIFKNDDAYENNLKSVAGCIAGGDWKSQLKKWTISNCLYSFSEKIIGIKYGDTHEEEVILNNVIPIDSKLIYEDLPVEFKDWTLTSQGFLIPCKGFA